MLRFSWAYFFAPDHILRGADAASVTFHTWHNNVQASVLTLDTFQQRTATKGTTARGQVVTDYAFLAERLVVLAGLVR